MSKVASNIDIHIKKQTQIICVPKYMTAATGQAASKAFIVLP